MAGEPNRGAVLLVTFSATLALGVELGLAVGVVLNVLLYLLRRTRASVVEVGRVEGTGAYRNVERYRTVVDPAVAILRMDAALKFLNANAVLDRLSELAAQRPELRAIVLSAAGLDAMDSTGLHALQEIVEELGEAGVDLQLALIRGPVRDALARAGHWEDLRQRCHPDIHSALDAAGVAESSLLRTPHPDEVATQVY